MSHISIIIPTWNEAGRIRALLEFLRALDGSAELIVADGGSRDGTPTHVQGTARVINSGRGRAEQMNAGAHVASGDVLWFLHADCRPHVDSLTAMAQALRDPRTVGGAFEYSLDSPGWIFRASEVCSNAKNRLLNLVYGDMGIFVRTEVFRRLGGYRESPLMEDMELCRRLKRQGRMVILPQRMETSARRWIAEGAMRNIVRNWCLQATWFAGVPAVRLWREEKDLLRRGSPRTTVLLRQILDHESEEPAGPSSSRSPAALRQEN